MKFHTVTAVVATLALTSVALGGVAMAFGPGNGYNRGNLAANKAMPLNRPMNNAERTPVFLDGWDANEDRTITLEEAKDHRSDLFDALDENEDGKIVAAEFSSFLESQKMPPEDATNGQRGLYGMTLSFNDVNKDGSVTKAEFIGQSQAFLDAMDRNDDGKVSEADFRQRWKQMGNRGPGMRQGMRQGMKRGMGQGRGMGLGMGQKMGPQMGQGMGQGMRRGMGHRMGWRWSSDQS